MVRVWQVTPAFLDDRRLYGEHVENHIVVSVHLKMLRLALAQGVAVPDIDWEHNRLGWRSHPQVTWWIGKVGALIERHEQLLDEMAWRQGEKHGSEEVYHEYKKNHASDISAAKIELTQLAPYDLTFGTFDAIIENNPQRVIIDLRHLLEKWDKDEDAGRPPKNHDPAGVIDQLIELVGDRRSVDLMLQEKLLT